MGIQKTNDLFSFQLDLRLKQWARASRLKKGWMQGVDVPLQDSKFCNIFLMKSSCSSPSKGSCVHPLAEGILTIDKVFSVFERLFSELRS